MYSQGEDQPDEGRETVESLDFTADELMKELLEALDVEAPKQKPAGEGWYTLAEIAAQKGWGLDKTRDRINRLVMQGIMEKSARIGVMKYYRMKPKEA